jgi:glycosyltransferase involved in cell wall biosynthesis
MTAKKVRIYNRWLTTLGGGEKHSLSIAEYLSRYFQVEVISHNPVSRQLAAERLNIDLSNVQFRFVPELSMFELHKITQNQDFFINASYQDYFPSLAEFSATLIYFPEKLNYEVALRRALKRKIQTWLDLPIFVAGVRKFYPGNQGFQWYFNRYLKIRLPNITYPYSVRFRIKALDHQISKFQFLLDEEPIKPASFTASGQSSEFVFTIPPTEKMPELELLLEDHTESPEDPHAMLYDLDLDLNGYHFYRRWFEKKYIGWGTRLQIFSQAYSILDQIDTYDVVWANSAFTQSWIRRYWNRESDLLYPLVGLESFKVAKKQPIILNVGRFFAGNHNKKHLEMVQTFKGMVDHGLEGWELHLVGNLAHGEEHKIYYDMVRQEARGYPINFHQDLPFNELVNLYASSSIYWHASGYGENEKRNPEKFEHFGISTVEAMASGCVPIVIGKGGQKEIVAHGESGFLWHKLRDLEKYTFLLIRNPSLQEEMSKSALLSAQKFNRANFEKRMDQFLEANNLV